MAKKLRKRIVRKATPEERERHSQVREQIAEELPKLKRKRQQTRAAFEALRDAMQALKQEREVQGIKSRRHPGPYRYRTLDTFTTGE